MITFSSRAIVPALLLVFLSACGGGGDGNDADDLVPTLRPASLVVSNASTPALNGTYSTGSINLTQVVKFNPIGAPAETCRFRFSGLEGPGGRLMDGDVRYRPGTFVVETMFTSIATIEFSTADGTNTAVDRANNKIDLTAKVFNPGTLSFDHGDGQHPAALGPARRLLSADQASAAWLCASRALAMPARSRSTASSLITDRNSPIGPVGAMPASSTAACRTRIGECASRGSSSGRNSSRTAFAVASSPACRASRMRLDRAGATRSSPR